MKRLSKENIQCIDTYLKNSDIQFIDVRLELVDHIATAIEAQMAEKNESFYIAFKTYFVENKKEILKNYERYRKKGRLRSFMLLWSTLKKAYMVFFFVAMMILIMNFENIFNEVFPYRVFFWGVLVTSVSINVLCSIPFDKNRFSNLEFLAWPIMIFTYVLNFIFNLGLDNPLMYEDFAWVINLLVSLFTYFNMAFVITFLQQKKRYSQKFKNLVE